MRTKPLLKIVLLVCGMAQIARATDLTYFNTATVTNNPNIDAINFVNFGTFLTTSVLPFDTTSTLNYTNRGTMIGSVGFDLSYAQNVGQRLMASSFRNWTASATITANDIAGGIVYLTRPAPHYETGALLYPSYLLISATNIINDPGATLSTGANGKLRLVGQNIQLTRSALQVLPIVPLSSLNDSNLFLPDIGIYDLYWGGTNGNFSTAGIYAGGTATTPAHAVTRTTAAGLNLMAAGLLAPFSFVPTFSTVYSNAVEVSDVTVTNATGGEEHVFLPSNVVVQAIMVGTGVNPFYINGTFYPSTNPDNDMQSASVVIGMTSTNIITGATYPEEIYITDVLASELNNVSQLPNISTVPTTFRPNAYTISRLPTVEYTGGVPGNELLTPGTLYSPLVFTNATGRGRWAAYATHVDNLATRPPQVERLAITDQPGRVEIVADSLDATKARVRGEGLISLQVKHLISSSNAAVDCQNLIFDIGSTNGNLQFQNLAKLSVGRFQGEMQIWSGFWTNIARYILTNYVVDQMNPTNYDGSTNFTAGFVTNYARFNFHALLINAGTMRPTVPVLTHDFRISSTNLAIHDSLTVARDFFVDSQSLTHHGVINIGITNFLDAGLGDILDIGATNMPNLLYLTNNGVINAAEEAHFGDDRATPLEAIVINGTNFATGQGFRSQYFESRGWLISVGDTSLEAGSAKLEGGGISAGGTVSILGGRAKLLNASVTVGGILNLDLTDSLSDNGTGSSNTLTANRGFNLLRKPLTGDLIGTRLVSIIPQFASVPHVWAGDDRGATAAGYLNNVAVGVLDLRAAFDSLFAFSGAGTANGLYVDYLSLPVGTTLQNLADVLAVDSNLTIYFAAASLPAEELDGKLNGRLRWVPDYAGPNSSVQLTLADGRTIAVNRALRESRSIDSDKDGLPNLFDASPFDGMFVPKLAIARSGAAGTSLTWLAQPGVAYTVESKSDLTAPVWELVTNFVSSASSNVNVTIAVPASGNAPTRFYRLSYLP